MDHARLLAGWHRLPRAVFATAEPAAHLHGHTLEIAATANGKAGCRGTLRWAAAAGSITVAQMLAGPAVAVPTVFFSASTNIGGTVSSQFVGGGCLSSSNPAGNASGGGCVDLFGPRGPTVTSNASAATGFDPSPPRPHPTGAQGGGQGRLQYGVSIATLAMPPTNVFSVPIHVFGSGAASISVEGDASANAHARLRIAGNLRNGPGPGAAAAVIDMTASVNSLGGLPESSSDFVVDQVVWLPPAAVFSVLMDNSSVAQAVADQFNPGNAAAGAYVDPLFTFDQPTFDALAASVGFASFDLGQYYRLVADVPEPGRVWLICAGLGAVFGRWRRRRLS